MKRHSARLTAGLLAAAVAAVVAGCGSSADNGTSGSGAAAGPPVAASKRIKAQVPQAIRRTRTLRVAADATYAPDEFIGPDGRTVVGMDADLAKALAGVMGLKAQVRNAPFDSIIPGLAAHKYDLGMSSFTDTKAREKTVDFVTYFSAGTSFFVRASGGPPITGLGGICGHRIAVEKGTTEAIDAAKQAKRCARKPTVSVFPDQNGANLALASGRADIGMADSPVAAYQVKKSGGRFKLAGRAYGTAPYGIAVPKGSGMTKPLLAAVKQLMASGRYEQILRKWGVQAGAIAKPRINGAIS